MPAIGSGPFGPILLVLIVGLSAGQSNAQLACRMLPGCACYSSYTRCTGPHFDFKSFTHANETLPLLPLARNMVIDNTTVTEVPNGIFQHINISIQGIMVNKNQQLTRVSGDAFKGMCSLRLIQIMLNPLLTTIERGTFNQCFSKFLYSINIRENRISYIPVDLFSNVPSIFSLDTSRNIIRGDNNCPLVTPYKQLQLRPSSGQPRFGADPATTAYMTYIDSCCGDVPLACREPVPKTVMLYCKGGYDCSMQRLPDVPSTYPPTTTPAPTTPAPTTPAPTTPAATTTLNPTTPAPTTPAATTTTTTAVAATTIAITTTTFDAAMTTVNATSNLGSGDTGPFQANSGNGQTAGMSTLLLGVAVPVIILLAGVVLLLVKKRAAGPRKDEANAQGGRKMRRSSTGVSTTCSEDYTLQEPFDRRTSNQSQLSLGTIPDGGSLSRPTMGSLATDKVYEDFNTTTVSVQIQPASVAEPPPVEYYNHFYNGQADLVSSKSLELSLAGDVIPSDAGAMYDNKLYGLSTGEDEKSGDGHSLQSIDVDTMEGDYNRTYLTKSQRSSLGSALTSNEDLGHSDFSIVPLYDSADPADLYAGFSAPTQKGTSASDPKVRYVPHALHGTRGERGNVSPPTISHETHSYQTFPAPLSTGEEYTTVDPWALTNNAKPKKEPSAIYRKVKKRQTIAGVRLRSRSRSPAAGTTGGSVRRQRSQETIPAASPADFSIYDEASDIEPMSVSRQPNACQGSAPVNTFGLAVDKKRPFYDSMRSAEDPSMEPDCSQPGVYHNLPNAPNANTGADSSSKQPLPKQMYAKVNKHSQVNASAEDPGSDPWCAE